MRSGGWKPFWAALFASLLVLVPLVGGTVLLSRQQLRTQLRQAARSESGVPIQLPKTTDQLTVLLCVSGEQPGFVLAYLNASQNCVHLLSVPAVLTVPFAEEETSLARCYAAAGPARCREALAQVLALPEGTRYLAFSPDVLERIASRYGPVRIGFSGALTEDELARYGRSRAVQGISAGDAHAFLCQLQADTALSPVRTAAARAAVWDAFLRQDLDLLPATLPDALRASSSALLTDLTALDYDALFIPRPQSAYIDINGTAAAAPGRHRGSRHAILLSRKPCIGERPYRYACGRKQQAVSCNSGFRQMLSHSYMFPPDCLIIPIISAPRKTVFSRAPYKTVLFPCMYLRTFLLSPYFKPDPIIKVCLACICVNPVLSALIRPLPLQKIGFAFTCTQASLRR